jgi:hypothetical protein
VQAGDVIGRISDPRAKREIAQKTKELQQLEKRAAHDPVYAPFVEKLRAQISRMSAQKSSWSVEAPMSGVLRYSKANSKRVSQGQVVATVQKSSRPSARIDAPDDLDSDAQCEIVTKSETVECTIVGEADDASWTIIPQGSGVQVGKEVQVRLFEP